VISVGHLMKLMDLWSRSDFYTVVVAVAGGDGAKNEDVRWCRCAPLHSTPLYSPRDLFK